MNIHAEVAFAAKRNEEQADQVERLHGLQDAKILHAGFADRHHASRMPTLKTGQEG